MKEIAADIYIEQNSLGLFTGIIQSEKGMVLIDSPLRPLENGLWKGSVVPDECCKQCYMVVLDTNYDRLLSIKGRDCAIVAHSGCHHPIRSRTPRVSEDPSNTRITRDCFKRNPHVAAEIIFDKRTHLHVDGIEVDLEHHAGSNHAGIWVVIPERNVVFVGRYCGGRSTSIPGLCQFGNLEADLELFPPKSMQITRWFSSRSGVVNADQIKAMIKQIANIRNTFEALKEINAPIEDWHGKIPQFLGRFSQLDLFNSELFYNRLHWGITTYYEFNCREKG